MTQAPNFDLEAVHRYFSAYCFNHAWDLMDQPARTPEEDEAMLRLSLASTWHWTQRPDCTPEKLSVGYWQTSRIYALLRQAENARRYAHLCLQESQKEGVAPFYLGYACEAAARALVLGRDLKQAAGYVTQGREAAAKVKDEEDRKALLADLDSIDLI